jgi:hypothetical protein
MSDLPIYLKHSLIPTDTYSASGYKGFKLKDGAIPIAIYKNTHYKKEYKLYATKDFIAKRKRVAKPFICECTKELIGECLYVINKIAKQKPAYYDIKDAVRKACEKKGYIDNLVVHASKSDNRDYIIRRDYEEDWEYEMAIDSAQRDERGRPYIPRGKIYLIFDYWTIGAFGFHSAPTRAKNKPKDAIEIEENFLAPRDIENSTLKEKYCLKVLNEFLRQMDDSK